MEEQIVPGAVVVMKSGGPALTVGSMLKDNAECHWFDEEGKPQTSLLPKSVLMVYDPVDEE
jgi:uncharacterized protein YodC (DUF2158 family)